MIQMQLIKHLKIMSQYSREICQSYRVSEAKSIYLHDIFLKLLLMRTFALTNY